MSDDVLQQERSSGGKRRPTISPPVFFTSGALLLAFLAFGVLFQETAKRTLPALLSWVTNSFGWLYVVSVTGFIGFCLWLLLSRHAGLRLGDDSDRPDFSTLTWFSMLFSAGMGIGLVFYGVAEPMTHYSSPPSGAGASPEAVLQALPLTYFHWGIHAWAIYALMGLGIAYFAFRRKLPLAIRSCFHPILGERIYGMPGHAIDVLAVLGTLFGLATSLGLGAMQVSAGLNHLFGLPHTRTTQLLLIAVITVCATVSLVTGVDKGIRRLSELNMTLAALLLLFVFLVGPTGYLVDSFVENLGMYVETVFQRSFMVGASDPQNGEWTRGWTLFYWGWWIAWAPFVGMFIARISKGRTIREFILGVLLVPTGVTFVWMTVFGGTALWLQSTGAEDVALAVSTDVSTAIYVVLAKLPLASITSFLAAAVVAVFFVTSSDSASFVVDMLTSGGHPDPPRWQRVFWASAEGATAAVLLYAGGEEALKALQAGVVSIGLPFCVVLVGLAVSLARALRQEATPEAAGLRRRPEMVQPTVEGAPMKLDRILVPVDYSETSRRAVEQAVELAAVSDGPTEIDVLHVATRPAEYLPLDRWIFGEEEVDRRKVDGAVKEAAREALTAFLDDLPEEVRSQLSPRVALGVPSQTILETLEAGRYDLVVMGTHGRTGADRVLIGSVAERVMRGAPCPVVTVR